MSCPVLTLLTRLAGPRMTDWTGCHALTKCCNDSVAQCVCFFSSSVGTTKGPIVFSEEKKSLNQIQCFSSDSAVLFDECLIEMV